MKYLLLLFFVSTTIYAQKGIIYYGQITSPGMKSASGPDLNAYLIFNNDQSYYVTAKDSLEKAYAKDNSVFKGDEEQTAMYVGNNTSRYGNQVFFDRDKDSIWWNQPFGDNIYIAEKRPEIEWKLEPETKKIGKFKTHKATALFRGRNYTAWYALEIPLPYGPWKLGGLPGLILEAYDTKKKMYLYFKNLEYPTENKAAITQVQRPKGDTKGWLTIEDFERLERNSLIKAYNNMVLRAEKDGSKKPIKPVFQEIYIESFE
jgi:GLPGLI family protein